MGPHAQPGGSAPAAVAQRLSTGGPEQHSACPACGQVAPQQWCRGDMCAGAAINDYKLWSHKPAAEDVDSGVRHTTRQTAIGVAKVMQCYRQRYRLGGVSHTASCLSARHAPGADGMPACQGGCRGGCLGHMPQPKAASHHGSTIIICRPPNCPPRA